ncbi:hypothetical protein LZF95_06170 [Algoriphagus sp. AGSA1]|uniref:hypothetical protein n=1 Tax=Algoriphagus sp. AGSA1 TaxID=2907213 RepID=UPI001F39901A|nr:hypothetical protein [Algoriphagus sp. AGSA1]MCE7054254.1 hypothetical protein [Algoriphagus sp. AGSA1]
MGQSNSADQDSNISKDMRIFLKTLNSGDEPPLETLSPKDARAVLTGAQESIIQASAMLRIALFSEYNRD